MTEITIPAEAEEKPIPDSFAAPAPPPADVVGRLILPGGEVIELTQLDMSDTTSGSDYELWALRHTNVTKPSSAPTLMMQYFAYSKGQRSGLIPQHVTFAQFRELRPRVDTSAA